MSRGAPLPAALLTALTAALAAASAPAGDSDLSLAFDGEVRARWEYARNVLDALDHEDATRDDEFDFFPYRVRFGAEATFREDVSGRIQIQSFGHLGHDFGGPTESFQDPVGQATRLSPNESEISLYQGYVDVSRIGRTESWSLRFGRAEHVLGNGLHLGNASFYGGTSFDGARVRGDLERFDVDLFYYLTNEDSRNSTFDASSSGGFVPFDDDDRTIAGAAFDVPLGLRRRHGVAPYLLVARDNDGSAGGYEVRTVGVLHDRTITRDSDVDDNPFDWSVELAFQSGSFEPAGADRDVSARVFEGWAGYSWLHGDGRSRVHVGYLAASGDDDPLDDELEAFVPLYPDHHANNRLGHLDLFGGPSVVTSGLATDNPIGQNALPLGNGLSNVTDLSVGYALWQRQGRHHVAVAVHRLALDEPAQAGFDADDIGTEIDAVYALAYAEHLDVEAGVAVLSPGDALDELTRAAAGRDADELARAWAQLRLAW